MTGEIRNLAAFKSLVVDICWIKLRNFGNEHVQRIRSEGRKRRKDHKGKNM